jgi:endonuclease/exonuclease/phosphatase family metal-dependent hydrolase
MRIATYNIWNNDTLFEERIDVICKAIKEVDADIVCLQEVRNEKGRNITEIIANRSNYSFFMFRDYPDCPDEGLAILSKFSFNHTVAIWDTNTEISNYCAIRARIDYEGIFIGITNVHLNWRSEKIRKGQLNAVNNWIAREKDYEKYEVMCGDFNDVPQSSVHNFIMDFGWKDVVELSSKKDESYYATFDLVNNHYLKEDKRVKEKLRFDWIMVNTFNNCEQFTVESVDIFGNNQSEFKIMPSDHYGLYVDMK